MTRLEAFAERATATILFEANANGVHPDDVAAARAVLEREVRAFVIGLGISESDAGFLLDENNS